MGQIHEAIEILEADLDIMKENGNLWLYPAANLEYGNMLRLEGRLSLFRRSGPALRSGGADLTGILGSKPEEIHAKFKIAKERTHHAFESRLHYRVHGFSELV